MHHFFFSQVLVVGQEVWTALIRWISPFYFIENAYIYMI